MEIHMPVSRTFASFNSPARTMPRTVWNAQSSRAAGSSSSDGGLPISLPGMLSCAIAEHKTVRYCDAKAASSGAPRTLEQ